MAFTAQMGGANNVEFSFNNFFAAQVTAKGVPNFLTATVAAPFPTALIAYDYPQAPLTFPAFSVTHLGAQPSQDVQGYNLNPGWKGGENIGIAEIDVWESYNRASGNHRTNITQMRDMAARVFATGAAIPILNVYEAGVTATGNGTIIRARRVREVEVPQDPNPDIVRKRLLVDYTWWERVTAG